MDQISEEVIDDDEVQLYELSIVELVVWCILYGIIALLAVVGNSLVFYITIHRLKSLSVTSYFIMNLALADILTGLLAIPFKFQAALFQEWRLPAELCQVVPYAETVTLSVSVFTLTASAIHEFRTVFFYSRTQMSTSGARILVATIWMIAAVVSLPHGLFHQVEPRRGDDNTTILQCLPVYASDEWWKAYNIYLTIITYFVPMMVLDTAYTMIALRMWTTSVSAEQLQGEKDVHSRRIIKMLIIVVACFSLCWLPLETYLLLNEVRPQINGWRYINVFFFCAHWLAMSNSCLNPIIYWLFNDRYKDQYQQIARELCCWWKGKDNGKFNSSTVDKPLMCPATEATAVAV